MNDTEWDMKTPGTGISSPPTGILELTRRPHLIGQRFWRHPMHSVSYELRFTSSLKNNPVCYKFIHHQRTWLEICPLTAYIDRENITFINDNVFYCLNKTLLVHTT